MLKIYPALILCLRFSLKRLGFILGFLLLLGIAIRALRGEPFIGFMLIFQLALLFAGLAALLGGLMYLILRVCAWSVEPSGISGRTYWGRRSCIAWTEVDKVVSVSIEGIPALVVTSANSKREVYAYTLGANVSEIHEHLSRHAGPDHVLTQWFRPAAA
jgi:hypothetical protein